MELNIGEYGSDLYCNANYDLSSASSITLDITRPDGTKLSVAATRGTVDATIAGEGTFAANSYAKYTLVDGDLNQAGEYRVRMTYLDGTKKLISVPDSFVVYE